MGNLCLGMNYYEFRANMNFKGRRKSSWKNYEICGATVHVVRVDSLTHPFVIGSITNKKLYQNRSYYNYSKRLLINSPIECASIESRIFQMSRDGIKLDLDIPIQIRDHSRDLYPVWISNGTFFDHHVEPEDSKKIKKWDYNYTQIVSPVIHQGVPIVDADRGRVDKSKFNRIYVSQSSIKRELSIDKEENFKYIKIGLRRRSDR